MDKRSKDPIATYWSGKIYFSSHLLPIVALDDKGCTISDAPSIIRNKEHGLTVVWHYGTDEEKKIFSSICEPNDCVWSKPIAITGNEYYSHPVLFHNHVKDFYGIYCKKGKSKAIGSFIYSKNGIEFQDPKHLPAGQIGAVSQPPQFYRGEFLIPTSTELFDEAKNRMSASYICFSTDGFYTGLTSQAITFCNEKGFGGPIEPYIFPDFNSKVEAFLKDPDGKDKVLYTTSKDGGYIWTFPKIRRDLPSKDSFCIIKIETNLYLAVYIDQKTNALTIAKTKDLKKSFQQYTTFSVDSEESMSMNHPSMILDDNGVIHLVVSVKNLNQIRYFKFLSQDIK